MLYVNIITRCTSCEWRDEVCKTETQPRMMMMVTGEREHDEERKERLTSG